MSYLEICGVILHLVVAAGAIAFAILWVLATGMKS